LNTESRRLFFALDPDPRTRERFVQLQAALDWPGRRVPAANLHMTLAFLGNVPVSALADLCALAQGLDFPAPLVRLDCAGSFRKSRVGWVGCARPPEALTTFQAELAGSLEQGGFRPDRRAWHPHVTLYRDLRNNPGSMDTEPVEWQPETFCLMHSGQCPRGVVYTVVGRWPG